MSIQSTARPESTTTPADLGPSRRAGDGLAALGRILWRRRLLMLLVLLLVAGSVGVGLTLAERTYTAQSRVALVPGPDAPTGTDYEALLRTTADVAVSRPVLSEVRDRLDDRSLQELRDQIESGAVTGTMLIQVSATDPDPDRAAQIANAVVALLPVNDPSNGTVRYDVTEPAAVPQRPSSPDVPVTVLAAAVLGVALAVASAVARDRIARTVETTDDLVEADHRVLGRVGPAGDLATVPALDVSSDRFADLRSLRVALEFASVDDPTSTLVLAPAVTDPSSGWLGVNLAVSLAEVGHRVLLVDADRSDEHRHPALVGEQPSGLYDVLAGTVNLPGAIHPGPRDGVDVLPLGNAELAAPSLLEMRFRCLLDQADPQDPGYDIVIVRAAPVVDSDDARVMAVDGSVLLTIPARRVKPAVLERVASRLQAGRTRVLGSVLTNATR